MKKLQLLEITTIGRTELRDKEDNIIQTEVNEISHVFIENGFRYEEDLCLSKLEPETTEKVIRRKGGTKVPTHWETKDEEWKENRYFGLRENAYACECERLTNAHPGRIFVVRIVDGF